MAHRIEVGFRQNMVDALGKSVSKRIIENLNLPVRDVETIDVYTIDADLSSEQLKMLGENLTFKAGPHMAYLLLSLAAD